jgi:uncharacterized protein YoaH (UPF0181 family)
MDNDPEWVKELLDQKKLPVLEKSIQQTVSAALERLENLQKGGMSYPQAIDLVFEALTPADGPAFSDNPPKPLSAEDQKKVRDILERRAEFQDQQDALRARQNPPTPTPTKT